MAGVEPIPELWTGLISSRRQRQKCADDVEELKRACEKDCAKQHVIQCEGCYHKVLERMRQRYADSTDPEWFSERKAFISELDGVFNDAKQYRNTVSGIEARVEAEKEAWYRWVFRKHPEYLQVSEDGPPLEVLREMLDDPECNRTDLIAAMWRGVGKTDNWQPKLEEFVEKVNGLAGHEEELRKLYLSRFFLDEAGNPVEHADECTRAFKQNQQKTIQGIATQIALENQRARSSQPQRDNHVKRLDELRRAKTAFEQNRMQAKRLQNQAQSMPIKEEFKVLPRCVSCKNVVAREDVISCSLCQTYLQMGGNGGLTLYCTVDCYQEGHPIHVESEHGCAAGPVCVQLTDEDVNMDGDFTNPVACKECADKRDIVIFCSERCARTRITQHRTSAHGVKTDPDEIQGSILPVSGLVDSVLDKANPGLKMTHMG